MPGRPSAGAEGELTGLAADISAIDRVTRMLVPDHQPKADHSRSQAVTGLYPRGELTAAAPKRSDMKSPGNHLSNGPRSSKDGVGGHRKRIACKFCQSTVENVGFIQVVLLDQGSLDAQE